MQEKRKMFKGLVNLYNTVLWFHNIMGEKVKKKADILDIEDLIHEWSFHIK